MCCLWLGLYIFFFFFSSRRRHTRLQGDWSSDVCSSDLAENGPKRRPERQLDEGTTSNFRQQRRSVDTFYFFLPRAMRASSSSSRSLRKRSEERRVGKECRSRWSR